jgi:hypothetical protein
MVYHGLAVKHLGKAVLITIFQTFTDWRRGASIETRSWLHAKSTFGHHHFSTTSPSGLVHPDHATQVGRELGISMSQIPSLIQSWNLGLPEIQFRGKLCT